MQHEEGEHLRCGEEDPGPAHAVVGVVACADLVRRRPVYSNGDGVTE
jgi:hypothetical protein